MVATLTRGVPANFTPVPGMHFVQMDSPEHGASHLTVHRVVRDALGMQHVVLTTEAGREISMFVEQLEHAVSTGLLAAVDSTPEFIAS